MPLILGMSVLLGCQVLGEMLTQLLGVAVPGPVFGMVILLVALLLYGKVPISLRITSEGLLAYLTLLFVPAGVGLVVHGRLIGDDWLPIGVTLLVSTVMTLVVTALVLSWLKNWRFQRVSKGHNEDDS